MTNDLFQYLEETDEPLLSQETELQELTTDSENDPELKELIDLCAQTSENEDILVERLLDLSKNHKAYKWEQELKKAVNKRNLNTFQNGKTVLQVAYERRNFYFISAVLNAYYLEQRNPIEEDSFFQTFLADYKEDKETRGFLKQLLQLAADISYWDFVKQASVKVINTENDDLEYFYLVARAIKDKEYALAEQLALEIEAPLLAQYPNVCKELVLKLILQLQEKAGLTLTSRNNLFIDDLLLYERVLFLAAKFNLEEEVGIIIADIKQAFSESLIRSFGEIWFKEKRKTGKERTALEYAILNGNSVILQALLKHRGVSSNVLKRYYELALAQTSESCMDVLLEHAISNDDYALVERLALETEVTQLSQNRYNFYKKLVSKFISELQNKNAFKYNLKGELVASEHLADYEKALFLAVKFNLNEEAEVTIASVRRTFSRNLVPFTEGDWFKEGQETPQEKTALEYAILNDIPAILEKLLAYRMIDKKRLERCYQLAKVARKNTCLGLLLNYASLKGIELAKDEYLKAFEIILCYLNEEELPDLNVLAEKPEIHAFSLEAFAILTKNVNIQEEKKKKVYEILISAQFLPTNQFFVEYNRYKVACNYFIEAEKGIASAAKALSNILLCLKKDLTTGDNIAALRMSAYIAFLGYLSMLVSMKSQKDAQAIICQVKEQAIFNEHRNTSNFFRRWYANHFKTATRSKLDELEKLAVKGKLSQEIMVKFTDVALTKYSKFSSKSK